MKKDIPKKIQGKCPECGSTLVVDSGEIQCTQDLLVSEYPNLFRQWDELSEKKRELTLSQVSFKVYDMYKRWSAIDDKGNRPQFCCTYNPNIEFNPMTQSEQILPDPVQVKISETILGRGLTEGEYYGIIRVPLINENGIRYFGQIDQLVFPRDYMTKPVKKREEDIEFTRIFDLDLIEKEIK